VTRKASSPLIRGVAEQLFDHALALIRRPASREELHHPAAEAVRIPVVKVLSVAGKGHLVPEQVRVVARVSRAAQHPQQRQVVQVAELLVAQARTPSDLGTQQACPHSVFHRQAQPQVRRHRQDGDHLSQPEPSPHDPSSHMTRRQASAHYYRADKANRPCTR
jgi:hypothetical protein